MAAQPKRAEKRIEEITVDTARWSGRDFRDLGQALGMPITQATLRAPTLDMVYGMTWIELRRLEPGLTFDEVLDMTLADLPRMEAAEAPKLRAVPGAATT